jgi:hypothetical protein
MATCGYLRRIGLYHRQEEARTSPARTTVAEHYRSTGRGDRFAVRWLVPGTIACSTRWCSRSSTDHRPALSGSKTRVSALICDVSRWS